MKKSLKIALYVLTFLIAGMSVSPAYAQAWQNVPEKQASMPPCDSVVVTNPDGSVTTTYIPAPVGDYRPSPAPEYRPDKFTTDPLLNSVTAGPLALQSAQTAAASLRPLSIPTKAAEPNTDAGQIPYTSDITPTGGRTYTVPISTVPDAKLAPNLALTYNSQAGNGVAGYGWSLSGLSSISMVGSTLYYDGSALAPSIDNKGHSFALDGVRIVNTSVTALEEEYQYETATGHILVKMVKSGEVVKYFEAMLPNGSRAVYGFKGNSETRTSYPLTEMTDLHGNVIVVSYHADYDHGVQYWPSNIQLKDKSSEEIGRITFSYEINRIDSYPSYYAGQRVSLERLLKSISTYSGSELLCTYNLTQSFDTIAYSYVLDAIGCTSGDVRLSPLTFTYGNLPLGHQYVPDFQQNGDGSILTRAFTSGNIRYIRGKFLTGNYSDGIIMLPIFDTYEKVATKTHWFKKYYQYNSLYSPNQSIVIAPCVGNYTDLTIKADSGFQTIEALDVDDDGTDEIVKVNFNGLDGDYTKLRIKIYKFNDTATALDSTVIDTKVTGVVNDGNQLWSPQRRAYWFGKFDANGGAQLVTISYNTDFRGNGRQSYTSVIDLKTGQCSESKLFDLGNGGGYRLVMADIDGNGITELCNLTASGLDRYSYLASDRTFYKFKTFTGLTYNDLKDQMFFYSDINGDGLLDIVRAPGKDSGNVWRAYCFTGNSFWGYSYEICSRAENDRFMLMDINGDGLADLLKFTTSGTKLSFFINHKAGFTKNANISSITMPKNDGVIPMNLLRYSEPTQFVVVEGFRVMGYKYSDNLGKNRLLTRFEDSYGVTHVNEYENMSESADVYQKDASRTYTLASGFSRRSFSANLIHHVKVFPNSNELSSEQTVDNYYTWYDAVYNSKGQGFCGFGKMRCIDYVNRVATIQTFDPEKRGVQTGSTKALLSRMDSPFETVENTYDSHSTTYGKLNPRLTCSVVADNLTGLKTTTSTTYGSYDYPTAVVKKRQIGTGEQYVEVSSCTYSHNVSSSRYVLGLPLIKNTDRRRGSVATGPWREKTLYSYDSQLRLSRRQDYVGKCVLEYEPSSHLVDKTKLVAQTEWTYDDYDNVISERTARNGATEFLCKSWTYDASHRHVASETDELGRVTRYAGYNRFGKPAHIVNHHGDTTSVSYDSWGNITGTVTPDGNRSWKRIEWGGTGTYTATETSDTKPTVVTHYDSFGRKVRTMTRCFDGKWRCVDYEYNAKGQLYRTSLPYRLAQQTDAAPARQWAQYTYDDYGRKTRKRNADGSESSWSYSDATVIETAKGLTRRRTYDAVGNLVKIVDDGGRIEYTLRNDGQPFGVVTGGIATTFSYDAYGRRCRIDDPSAGTQTDTTVWNADGTALRTQTNPNGQIVTNIDKFGRVTKIDRLGEYSTSYAYDDFGRLVSETSTNGTGKAYTYDRYDRVLTERETVPDGKWLQKSYAYGKGAQVNSVRYTNQTGDITTENYTWSNGTNTGIVLSEGTVVMRLDEENDLGAPVRVTTGEVSRTYSFTPYGHPTGRKMGDGSLMDFEYAFQFPTGNLYVRQDNTRNLAESFTYDGLNRLTEMEGRKVTYTSYGNVTKVDGVGTMRYGNVPQGPYQITSLTPEDDSLVPSREQSVSYTCYGRPSRLVEGGKSASFTYSGSGDRVKMLYAEGVSPELTRYYIGGRYEQDIRSGGASTERLYLGGDAYSAPMVLVREGSGSWTPLNIGRDYLGSVTHIVTADGTLLAEYSYDPWGRLRDPETQAIYAPGTEPALCLGRGFTGHEHLPWFGLINMNARLYDPLLCRFLSPDPYVQTPDFTQSFNRYSYGLNNPLSYTDPNGEFWHLIIGAVFGGIANLIGNWKNCDGFWEYLSAFGIGAAAGLAVAATGGAAAAAGGTALATAGVIGVGAAGGASTGAVNDIIRQTGKNFDGMDSVNWKSVGISAASGAVAGGVSAGVGMGFSGSGIPVSVGGRPVQSQLTKSFIYGALSGGAGHVAGGTTAGLLWGDSFKDAFVNSFDGLGSSMLMGGAFAATATFAYEVSVEFGPDYFGITDEVNRIQNGVKYDKYWHDGTLYQNGKGQLPTRNVTYTEYVVPPKTGPGPGAMRIVVGSDNNWYYTPDHYNTFYHFIP